MRDDPRKNLKWMEQQLLAEETLHRDFSKLPDKEYHKDEDLLELVDMLLEEDSGTEVPAPPIRSFSSRSGRITQGEQAAQVHAPNHLDKNAYVPVKTKKQLRKEARQQKKSNVNRSIGGLVFLAVLECIGIFVLLGWWLQ